MRMARGINILIFILAVLSFANSESSNSDRNKAEKQPCFAPVVKEGQAGKLTFFIGHALISSTDFFATIKRAKNPVKDILVCTPGPPMNCKVDSPYLWNGTANDSLTLLIPNITKEFADTYLLQIYASGSFQQPSVCPLVVKDEYILVCTRKSPIRCNVNDKQYRSRGIRGNRLDLWIPNVTTEFDDSYVFQVYANGSFQHPDTCHLVVKAPGRPCRAHATTEGLTGTLTYFIHSDALSSADFFATIRRTRRPDEYILVCTRKSPIRCNVNDKQYRSRGIRGNRLDLWIPNVTTEFDDSYVFQVYANGSFHHPDTCHLVVKAPRRPCRAHATTEGLTGTLTYFIHSDALSSADFFATIRRTRRPDEYILVCTRKSPIRCNVNDKQYRSRGIRGNRLDLWIPNVTTEFDDSYVFQVYANGSAQHPDTCHLVVKGQITDTVTGDENVSKVWIPVLIMCLFLLLVIGIGLLVWKKNPDCWQECRRRLLFKADENQQEAAPKRPDEQDQGETKPTAKLLPRQQTQNQCPPSNKNQQEATSKRPDEQDQGETKPAAKLLPRQQIKNQCPPSNKNQQEATSKRPDEQDQGETKPAAKLLPRQQTQNQCPPSKKSYDVPDTSWPDDQGQQTPVRGKPPQHVPPSDKTPIEREQIISHEGMRWFVGNRSDDEVDNLFECVKPRAGHFLITQSKADLSSFTLFVCWKGWKDQPKVDRFYITHNDSGFTVNLPNTQFDTLCELVKFYRTNPMHVGGKDLGALSKPCEEEPKDAWYFGSLNGDKVGKLLLTRHTEEGSFVVTKSSTNEDNYTLSVKFGGKLVPFTIVPRDDGFKITHLIGSFMTLKKLVEHYRKNDLDGLGTLKKSLEIIPEELTTKEKLILEKNGPGSFFFKDSSIPGRRVLAVNANSEMKQLVIIKSNDSCRLADHDIQHRDEGALEKYCKAMVITIHGEEYCKLKTNCTHKLDKK